MRGSCITLVLLAMTPLFGAKPDKKKAHTAAQGYVGTEACLVCHEDLGKSMLQTRHGLVEKEKSSGWQGQSCESCHGPGQKHGEAAEAKFILNPGKVGLAPREADASCLGCHKKHSGSHSVAQVGCLSCHSVHHAISDTSLPLFRVAKSELPTTRASRISLINQQCTQCHGGVLAEFQRPHAHLVPQGAVSCVDCHNPHGSNRQAGLHSNQPGCLNCHSDKRGPFAFEHAPMRLEGCGACHEAHGSANPRMLTRARVANLCLECHSNLPGPSNRTGTLGSIPTGFHDLRLPVYQNCTTCHTKVHGSHASRDLLR